jgi:hypothetical protein
VWLLVGVFFRSYWRAGGWGVINSGADGGRFVFISFCWWVADFGMHLFFLLYSCRLTKNIVNPIHALKKC